MLGIVYFFVRKRKKALKIENIAVKFYLNARNASKSIIPDRKSIKNITKFSRKI